MKKCPSCGYIIENDNAKFCRKCGAKQPEINLVTHNPSSDKTGNINDGILLGNTLMSSVNDDDGLSLASNQRNEGQIISSLSSSVSESDSRNLWWAVKTCFKKYATFNGRASRSEYWFFYLFNCIISLLLFGLAVAINQEDVSLIFLGLYFVYSLVVFLPSLAVTVRRLHDIGKSGWLYLIVFIPCVGPFILLYYLCEKSESEENIYGLSN